MSDTFYASVKQNPVRIHDLVQVMMPRSFLEAPTTVEVPVVIKRHLAPLSANWDTARQGAIMGSDGR